MTKEQIDKLSPKDKASYLGTQLAIELGRNYDLINIALCSMSEFSPSSFLRAKIGKATEADAKEYNEFLQAIEAQNERAKKRK